MSGQLVGEVIDAFEACAIKLDLPQRLALIAIAEKCYTSTRQGNVRIGRIQAVTGKSLRTARRYVAELVAAELIQVVKRGYKAPGRDPVPPVYELSELVQSKVTQAQAGACAKSAEARAKSARACAIDPPPTSGDKTIDGKSDGNNDGGARASAAPPPPSTSPPEEEPPPYCPKHMPNGTADKCRDCGTFRVAHDAWTETEKVRRAVTLRTFWQDVEDCADCGPKGVNDFTGRRCPKHDWEIIRRFRNTGVTAA